MRYGCDPNDRPAESVTYVEATSKRQEGAMTTNPRIYDWSNVTIHLGAPVGARPLRRARAAQARCVELQTRVSDLETQRDALQSVIGEVFAAFGVSNVIELAAAVHEMRRDAERWRALAQHSGPAHDAVHVEARRKLDERRREADEKREADEGLVETLHEPVGRPAGARRRPTFYSWSSVLSDLELIGIGKKGL